MMDDSSKDDRKIVSGRGICYSKLQLDQLNAII